MILTGKEIERRLGGDIFISDFNEAQLGSNSYDVRLDASLSWYSDRQLDMRANNLIETVEMHEHGFVLYPGRVYLGRTMERTVTKNLVPRLDGRSSVGRLGIFVHVTAGFGDVGFDGYWTMELVVVQPVRIYPGVRIAQLSYHTVLGEVTEYAGKYQRNEGTQPSMFWKDARS